MWQKILLYFSASNTNLEINVPHILIAAGLAKKYFKNFYTSQLAIQISRFNTAKNVAPYTHLH